MGSYNYAGLAVKIKPVQILSLKCLLFMYVATVCVYCFSVNESAMGGWGGTASDL